MSELADALTNEADIGGIAPAEIPDRGIASDSGAAEVAPNDAPEKPLSLREQINKSFDAVRKEEATRARDVQTGKFAKVDASAAGTARADQEKPAAAEKPSEPTTEQTVPHGGSNPDAPPSAWKAIWENLTPEARAIAVKRETEVAKGFEEYRTKTAQFSEISQALDPIRPILQQNGIQSDAQAVKQLLQWEGSFRNPATRVQAFHQLAQQYGVDLNSLVQNPSQPSSAQEIPEPLRPVIDQFGNIVQKVNTIEQQLQTAEQNRISNELSTFASKPEHPHFDKVRVMMGQLMNAGVATDLESAYQKATLLHPEVSAAIKAEETAKAAAELAKTNAEKVKRAQAASVSPAGRSPNGASANPQAKQKQSSVRDSLLSSIGELREGQRA